MKTCKWCRRPIREGWEKHFGELIAPWIHTSGMYTCPTHPVTLAEPADERWEKVWASIGPVYVVNDEDAVGSFIEFRIEVPYGDTMYYVIQRIDKTDLEELPQTPWDLKRFFLNEMVDRLDEYLKEAS